MVGIIAELYLYILFFFSLFMPYVINLCRVCVCLAGWCFFMLEL